MVRSTSLCSLCSCGLLLSLFVLAARVAPAGEEPPQAVLPLAGQTQLQVSRPLERLELMVNTSRVLTLQANIPRVFVSNPQVLKATPLSPNQVQVSGLKAGMTQVNLWDEEGQIYTVDVVVMRDVTQLAAVLQGEFPEANLRVRALANSVYLSGYVPRPELVGEIMTLASAYESNVINGINVGGVHQVALHVKVMEVSRTKLRELGLDWQYLGDSVSITQAAGGILDSGGGTVQFSIVGDSSAFLGFLAALRQQDLAKTLAEPTLTAMTGRTASFFSGGRIPFLEPQGLGTTTYTLVDYGTRVDFVPIVLGNGNIRLEVRPSVSELDSGRGIDVNGTRIPAFTERRVDTAVEMRAGQTLALAGLIQQRVESQNRGVPLLADLPVVGRAFSRVRDRTNEVELLIVVTPEIVAPLEPHQVPQCGPGQLTVSPNDAELYGCGYVEVPNCCLFGPPAPTVAYPHAAPAGGPFSVEPVSTGPPAPAAVPADAAPLGPPVRSASWASDPAAESRRLPPSNHRSSLIGPLGYDPLP